MCLYCESKSKKSTLYLYCEGRSIHTILLGHSPVDISWILRPETVRGWIARRLLRPLNPVSVPRLGLENRGSGGEKGDLR